MTSSAPTASGSTAPLRSEVSSRGGLPPAPRALATSWLTMPYGTSSSASSPLARSTAASASPAANRASRLDLPRPASPSTSTTLGWPPHAPPAAPRRDPRQQARLAEASLALDQHDLRLAAAGLRGSRLQHGQLIRPADEHSATRRPPGPNLLVHPKVSRILFVDRACVPSGAGFTASGVPVHGHLSVPRLLGLRQQPPPAVFAAGRRPQRGPAPAGGVKAYPHYLY